MQKQKGFTIIELIVVIAIIAILAAIVMVNVVQYINRSKEAAIKASMDSLSVVATKYIDEHGSIDAGFCAGPEVVKAQDLAASYGYHLDCGWQCDPTPQISWLLDAYKGENYLWCVDYMGHKMPFQAWPNYCDCTSHY
jgi:prepilin-type N-terminal cleavage/methylation domain-containing protein